MSARRTSADQAPLLAWGDSLRKAQARRRVLQRRGALMAAGLSLLVATIAVPPRPRLVWNASESVPIGLYSVTDAGVIDVGDTVVARLPAPYRGLAAEREYLPRGVPLVKRVAAAAGDEVCAIGDEIFINGTSAAQRYRSDLAGRPMPWWEGCRRLRAAQVLLLMRGNAASFDGRYFGPISAGAIVGKARLLWAR